MQPAFCALFLAGPVSLPGNKMLFTFVVTGFFSIDYLIHSLLTVFRNLISHPGATVPMRKHLADILICLLISTVCLTIYYQTKDHSYILYDDPSFLDPSLRNGAPLENIERAASRSFGYVPYLSTFPAVVRIIQWSMAGNDIGKLHLYSLFWHLANSIMLFLLLRFSTGMVYESGLCAILFTVHPLNVEPVCWLSGLNGLLTCFFLMLMFLCYLYYIKRPTLKRYLLMIPPFSLGILCKPTIAIAPLLLLLFDYWPFQRLAATTPSNTITRDDHKFKIYSLILEKLPLAVLVILYLLTSRFLLGMKHQQSEHVLPGFHPGAVVHLANHLAKIIWPTGLTICQPQPPEAPLWKAVIIIMMIFVSCLLSFKARRSHKYIITGWLWFITSLSPAILMVSLSGRPAEDRYFYIPLIGVCIIFSFGISTMATVAKGLKPLVWAAAVLIISLFIHLSYLQTKYWKNSITVFSHAISLFPDNIRARANLGDAFLENGDIRAAIDNYRQLVKITPNSAAAHTMLANALARNNMDDAARNHYKKAISLAPDYVFAYHGFADFLANRGELDNAIKYYRLALKISPYLVQTHNNLAIALLKKGEIQEAVFHLKEAIRIDPDYKTARENLEVIIKHGVTPGRFGVHP